MVLNMFLSCRHCCLCMEYNSTYLSDPYVEQANTGCLKNMQQKNFTLMFSLGFDEKFRPKFCIIFTSRNMRGIR